MCLFPSYQGNHVAALRPASRPPPEAFIHVTDGLFDDSGNIAREGSKKFLKGWVDRYAAWVMQHAG